MNKNIEKLKQKFLDGDKLNLLDNMLLNVVRRISDCDGMCNNCDMWYCHTYKNKQEEYAIK